MRVIFSNSNSNNVSNDEDEDDKNSNHLLHAFTAVSIYRWGTQGLEWNGLLKNGLVTKTVCKPWSD